MIISSYICCVAKSIDGYIIAPLMLYHKVSGYMEAIRVKINTY